MAACRRCRTRRLYPRDEIKQHNPRHRNAASEVWQPVRHLQRPSGTSERSFENVQPHTATTDRATTGPLDHKPWQSRGSSDQGDDRARSLPGSDHYSSSAERGGRRVTRCAIMQRRSCSDLSRNGRARGHRTKGNAVNSDSLTTSAFSQAAIRRSMSADKRGRMGSPHAPLW